MSKLTKESVVFTTAWPRQIYGRLELITCGLQSRFRTPPTKELRLPMEYDRECLVQLFNGIHGRIRIPYVVRSPDGVFMLRLAFIGDAFAIILYTFHCMNTLHAGKTYDRFIVICGTRTKVIVCILYCLYSCCYRNRGGGSKVTNRIPVFNPDCCVEEGRCQQSQAEHASPWPRNRPSCIGAT